MKTRLLTLVSFVAFAMNLVTNTGANAQEAVQPIVYQAAGPDAASIQGTVDAYRLAVGDPNNQSDAGPLPTGRREINWDGNASDATTVSGTPLTIFLNSRGSLSDTPGSGFALAPASGGPQGGLAVLFNDPDYANIFTAFSPVRLFTAIDSRVTNNTFFVPGTNGATQAAVNGFGVIFTDVDKPNDSTRKHKTLIEYYDANDNLLYTGLVPSSPGDGSVSFFGIVFPDARIVRVRIKSGDGDAGVSDGKKDIVMMDDFIYGEPQPLP